MEGLTNTYPKIFVSVSPLMKEMYQKYGKCVSFDLTFFGNRFAG
jgi:hypothetical protein